MFKCVAYIAMHRLPPAPLWPVRVDEYYLTFGDKQQLRVVIYILAKSMSDSNH